MADKSRERALETALFQLSEAWRKLGPDGWLARRFRQMIDPKTQNYRGGIWTVRHLLYTSETSGFKNLRNHQHLTVESFVLSGEWDDLFDNYDKQAAKRKLEKRSK